ncbi:MAG: N-acetyltransferase DgcN [Alphaproteobacteria bacterium]
MQIDHPYLMFLGDAADQLAAKTAQGIVHWRRDWCVGQLRLENCNADLGLPDMTIDAAAAAGVRTMVIGVANRGGVIGEHWVSTILQAIEAGMDVASGLHARIADIPDVAAAAVANGAQLFDVRHPSQTFDVGTGARRQGKRLLAVGTDCSVGKMYTALAVDAEMRQRGMDCDFRATGQTGIFIAGSGVSVDAVVSDFISGATEWLAPANAPGHWDLVEGQGSLFHPSYAGVTMGLVHGAQPDALVLCHEPTRSHMRGLPHQALPDIGVCIDGHLAAARLTNPDAQCVGIAVNTSAMGEAGARADLLAGLSDRFGLPALDPVRDGVAPIVERLIQA